MKTFDYPFFSKLIRIGYLIIALVVTIVVAISSVLTVLTVFTGFVLPSNVGVPENPSIILLNVLFVCIFVGIALVNHLMFPAIRVGEDSFQLRTVTYESRWFKWAEISRIKEHWLSNRRRRILGFVIKDLNPIYFLLGILQLYGAPAFFINDKLKGYEQLLEIIQEKRPDLFEQ